MTDTLKNMQVKRVSFLKDLSYLPSKKNIVHILNGLTFRYDDAVSFNYVDDGSGVFSDLVVDLNAGRPVMLVGPKASGKNTVIENLARLYTQNLREIQCNAYTDLDTLLGMTTLATPNGKSQPEVVFMPSELILAMEEGDFIVFDEINTVSPAVLAVINGVIDTRRRIMVPGYGLVKAHPNFRVFATMNEDYQGVVTMNEATASRFSVHYLSLPNNIGRILKTSVPTAKERDIRVCQLLYHHMLGAVRRGDLSSDALNIRSFLTALERTLWDMPIKRALNAVANALPSMSDRIAVKELILIIKEVQDDSSHAG